VRSEKERPAAAVAHRSGQLTKNVPNTAGTAGKWIERGKLHSVLLLITYVF
jgi:hypothetical protein